MHHENQDASKIERMLYITSSRMLSGADRVEQRLPPLLIGGCLEQAETIHHVDSEVQRRSHHSRMLNLRTFTSGSQ